jgi:hypothetical protein
MKKMLAETVERVVTPQVQAKCKVGWGGSLVQEVK